MKSFEKLSEKQQTILTFSMEALHKSLLIKGAKSKSIEPKEMATSLMYVFNLVCERFNCSVGERVEMLPFVLEIMNNFHNQKTSFMFN